MSPIATTVNPRYLIDDPLASEDDAHASMGEDDIPSPNDLDENMGGTAEVRSTEVLAGYF